MTNRSIKSRVLITLIAAMFMISVVVGGISIFEVEKLIGAYFHDTMESDCAKESLEINNVFAEIEKTAEILKKYALYELHDATEETNDALMAKIKQVFINVSKNEENVSGVYFVHNPQNNILGNDFRLVKDENGEYASAPIANKSVGTEAKWCDAEYDEYSKKTLSAYEMPIYGGETLYGVVGLEVDYGTITSVVDQIKINKNGFAYLVKDGKIEYHKDLQKGMAKPDTSKEYFEIAGDLGNGCQLVLAARYADMDAEKYAIGFKIWGIVIALAFVFIFVAFAIVKKIVNPIKELTEASEEIAKGNYDVKIAKASTREIASLSAAFERMAQELQDNDRYMRRIAFRDPLTKLRNRASYEAWIERFDEEIELQEFDFGVVVLDINGLKETNDFFGHEVGNKLIFAAAQIISEVFKRSPIFRIGGDEFVVALTGADLQEYKTLARELANRCESEFIKADGKRIPVSIAKGVAFFDGATDNAFRDVFKRADEKMYIDKRRIKEGN
ncbi:MAG: diguanylate cyclase [Clostridia bacterium]|nr:diguanylate cyclase [Clostridia bacterium]